MTYGVGKTDIGKLRKNNEDSILVSNSEVGCLPNLYIVADGMGGHNAGEVASENAITFFCEYAKENSFGDDILDFLISCAKYANKKVLEAALQNKEFDGMGTTFTACTFYNKKLFGIHIGDSRIYKFNGENFEQITNDHTYVSEMVRSGQLTKEEATNHPNKNIITRAVGIEEDIYIDGIISELDEKNFFLLCSDGLSNKITNDEIALVLKEKNTLDKKVDSLIESAIKNGGEDNISVILIEKARS